MSSCVAYDKRITLSAEISLQLLEQNRLCLLGVLEGEDQEVALAGYEEEAVWGL